jgi:hypothetical protein
LVLGNFEVIGELFGCQEAGHGPSQGVALRCEQFDGVEVVFDEGACPSLVGLADGFVQRLAFEDEGSELDGPVGRGGDSALGGGDEPRDGVQADGVAEEARDAPGFFGGDSKLRLVRFLSLYARLSPNGR